MSDTLTCKYEKCDTTNLAGGAQGHCAAHYKQLKGGEVLRPARGSKYFWEDKLNADGEKLCTRCEYWLPITDFPGRKDSSAAHSLYGRAHCKRCNVLRRMSITARDYDRILAAQRGGCAICGKSSEPNGRMLSVDHDHACCTGNSSCGRCIRGILCDDCNVLLSRAHDSVRTLHAAANYLVS